ncbi:MAG TPA: hypothetical protein VNF99_14000 [Stellaceae bacterium]|nr:hypothetical protein [Stellaceae bacterium]
MRWMWSAGTGAVIGAAVAMALDLSFRWLRRPAGAGTMPAMPWLALDPQAWPVKAAIVAAAIVFYALVGYLHRPHALPAAEPPAATATAPAADTGPVSLAIGGVTLSFAPPAGSCLYPAPLLEAVKLQQSRLNPDNAIHTAFADCSQLRAAAVSQARIRDFGILMTPKADLTRPIDRAALDAMAAATPDPTGIKATLDQRLSDAQSKLALQSFSALGAIDRDPQGIYFAYLSKARSADGDFTQACVMGLAAINGRLVAYYLYGDYAKDPRPVIFGLLAKVKAGVSDLAQRNRM